jgi:hypothetical protein
MPECLPDNLVQSTSDCEIEFDDMVVEGDDFATWFFSRRLSDGGGCYAECTVMASRHSLFSQQDGRLVADAGAVAWYRSRLATSVPDIAFASAEDPRRDVYSVLIVVVQGAKTPAVCDYCYNTHIVVQVGATIPFAARGVAMKMCSDIESRLGVDGTFQKDVLRHMREAVGGVTRFIKMVGGDDYFFDPFAPPEPGLGLGAELEGALDLVNDHLMGVPVEQVYSARKHNFVRGVVDAHLGRYERAIAVEVVRATVSAHLERIKARLWRPDGRLVQRMIAVA